MRRVDENARVLSDPPPVLDYGRPSPTQSRRTLALVLLLVGLTLLAYLPVLRGGFIWDDDDYVTTNLAVQSPAGLRDIWAHPSATPQYYPMVFTSFWIEHAIWGLRAPGYHIVNVLLHALAAILLWRVLETLDLPGAFLAACLFAVHPINAESVAWIAERKNVLSAVFYFTAALVFLRGRPMWALFLFVLALLSKSVTCSLPAALLLVIWWKHDRKLNTREIISLALMFVIGLALAIHTAMLERTHVSAVGAEWNYSFIDRLLVAGRAVWFYLGKLILPAQLSFVYPKWTISPSLFWQWTFPLGVVVAVTALWLQRDKWGRGPMVAALFFIGTLVPALGFFNIYPMRYTFVADHYAYLASVGVIAVVAVAIDRFGRPAAVGVIALLLVLTMLRAAVFRDVELLWRDTLAKNPDSWMVHLNLAKVLDSRHNNEETETRVHFQRAVELAPDIPDTHLDLGTYFSNHDRFDEAIAQYRRALELNPNLPQLHYHLARTYASMERFDDAIAEYEHALKLRPDYPAAHLGYARALYAVRRGDEAKRELLEAIRLDPRLAPPPRPRRN